MKLFYPNKKVKNKKKSGQLLLIIHGKQIKLASLSATKYEVKNQKSKITFFCILLRPRSESFLEIWKKQNKTPKFSMFCSFAIAFVLFKI